MSDQNDKIREAPQAGSCDGCGVCGASLQRCPPPCSRWFCPRCDIEPEERW